VIRMLGPTGSRRRRRSLLGAFAAALMVFATMPAALAEDGPYTIDGDIPDVGTTELPDPFGNVKELGPINGNTTKIGVIHNDALPTLGLTNPNAQVDLRRAWLDTELDTSTSHTWLYFAWERDSNSGSGFIAYEFMKNPAPAGCAYDDASDPELIANCNPWANRTAGDFMILWDQQGNSLDLYLRTWSGTAPNLTLGAPTPLSDEVSQAAYSADGFRGEAAVDLTATIFGGSTTCQSFANTIPSTVTGNSDTADYKDTILQTAPPITNCGTVTVIKVTKDTSGNVITDDATEFTFSTSVTTCPAGSSTCPNDVDDFQLTGRPSPATPPDTKTISDVLPGTGLTVSETLPAPSPYALVDISCIKNETAFPGDAVTGIATFDIAADDSVTCTFTNQKQKQESAMNTAPWIYPNDTANVTSAGATGTVTFKLFGGTTGPEALANCQANGSTGLLYSVGPVTLSSGTASTSNPGTTGTPNSLAISSTQQVYWRVEYSGDANYFGRLSNCVENVNTTLTGDTGGENVP
jgi:hypothetical protein